MTTDTLTLTLTEAAARVGVHRRTLRAWIRKGRLPATRTPGGHYRIRVADLEDMPLTATAFARAVGVCSRTAQRWAQQGRLRSRRTPGGWEIAASEVERIGRRPRRAKSADETAQD